MTVDEPSHLVSSYLYWNGADRLQPGDMPPLIKMAGGWVPQLLGLPLPPDLGRAGETRHEWGEALGMMERLGNERVQWVFFWSRLPLLIFPLLTCALVWRWGRQLFGAGVGLLLMLAFALEPTALAHGSIFKNDLAATFGYLWFWYRAWKYWRSPGKAEAAWLGAALLAAMLAKMSLLFLIGVAPAVIAARWLTRRELGARQTAAAVVIALLVPYAGTVAAYQFRASRISTFDIESYAAEKSLPSWFAGASHVFRVLPVPRRMWEGCTTLFEVHARPVPVYMLGEVYPQGHPLYFLVALAVKIPAPIQILLVGGVALAVAGIWRRRLKTEDTFWLLPGFLYVALASLCAFQLGVRLVLPALPFGLLVCGLAIQALWRGRRRVLPVLLLGWLAVAAARVYPHGISFMNAWTGGPDNGLKYLADSNIDWGHGLPELARFVQERHIGKFRLSYFGTDNPYRFFAPEEMELVAPPWSDQLAGRRHLVPKPGYYAISASLLPGQFFQPKYRDFYRAFRDMHPVAKVADSIYMYKVGL